MRPFSKMHIDIVTRTDLPSTAKLVYSVIDERTGRTNKNGDPWPGIRTLAKDIGMSVTAVMRALVVLEDRGLIEITKGGDGIVSHYVTTDRR